MDSEVQRKGQVGDSSMPLLTIVVWFRRKVNMTGQEWTPGNQGYGEYMKNKDAFKSNRYETQLA